MADDPRSRPEAGVGDSMGLLRELQESIGTVLLTLDRDAPWAVIKVAALNLEERCKRVVEANIPDSTIIRGGDQ